jgi:hypothetical protein
MSSAVMGSAVMTGLRCALGVCLSVLLAISMASCGGNSPGSGAAASSSSSSVPAPTTNVVSVVVDGGPPGLSFSATNTLYTTVTVCVPGSTTQCQTIDNIQVDTGSYGLRVLASVLTLTLPLTAASDGNTLVECTQFVDGYSWGPIATADFTVAGESASSMPVQIIGSPNFTQVPPACSSVGPAEDSVAQFGANGILGIGVFEQDCGPGCVPDPNNPNSADNGIYYSCTSSACSPIAVALASQVPNPVPLFAADNNGTIIVLPSVAASGTATVTGSLIFGIDTETNNASGTQTVLQLDGNGDFTTAFNGQTLSDSFIDSGTNGLFFNDSSITVCSSSDFTNFYCPASTLNLSATLTGTTNVSATVDFGIGNAETMSDANPTFTAMPELGGTYSSSSTTFDWGLPFFYGRRVANAVENHSTSVGAGPYVAF